MLNYNNVIKDVLNHNGLSVREISPIMKLKLRGKKREFFTTVGKGGKHMMGKKLFIPMEDKTIKVFIDNPVFFDEENKRLNA